MSVAVATGELLSCGLRTGLCRSNELGLIDVGTFRRILATLARHMSAATVLPWMLSPHTHLATPIHSQCRPFLSPCLPPTHPLQQANQPNEVEETIKSLKANPGVESIIVVKNDGIVIRNENVPYLAAVQHAALVLDLCSKSKALVGGLFEAPENEVASIRLRAHCTYTGHQHEMIVAQTPQYTLIVLQGADDGKDVVEDDEKE